MTIVTKDLEFHRPAWAEQYSVSLLHHGTMTPASLAPRSTGVASPLRPGRNFLELQGVES
jgi:hypothetical protein